MTDEEIVWEIIYAQDHIRTLLQQNKITLNEKIVLKNIFLSLLEIRDSYDKYIDNMRKVFKED